MFEDADRREAQSWGEASGFDFVGDGVDDVLGGGSALTCGGTNVEADEGGSRHGCTVLCKSISLEGTGSDFWLGQMVRWADGQMGGWADGCWGVNRVGTYARKKIEFEELFSCKVVRGRVNIRDESIHMLISRKPTQPNSPSAMQKQGRLCGDLGGRPAGNHQDSSPKFGPTEYSRSESRKLGNLDEEWRR